MRGLLAKTIWAPDALPLVQKRFKPVFRVFLPFVDLLFIAFGALGLFLGSKVVETFTLHWYNPFWASIIGICAAGALLGLVFQRNYIEIASKVGLVISLLIYAFILGLNVQAGSYNSSLTITLALIVAMIPAGRIVDLIGEIARKDGGTA